MTNSEIVINGVSLKETIEELELLFDEFHNKEFCTLTRSRDYMESLSEENDKFKDEIEQLKDILNIRNKENMSLLLQRKGLEVKIEQLKSELEKSAKLPCKLRDMVWQIVECADKETRIFKMKVCNICEYGSFYNSSITPFIWNVYMESEENSSYAYATFYDFGKSIFLTREEAEQHLKGKVEE